MKIDIVANDGSPLGVTEQSICGTDGRNGVGGAELAILTLCRGWHERGHEVTFYNDPSVRGGSIFPQKRISEFKPNEDRDVMIVFRSPNPLAFIAKGKKIWFSTDQYTIGDFKGFARDVHKIVGISQFHSDYFKRMYGIHTMKVIDIPVRDWEYNPTAKRTNSCIFTSVPDRGLMELRPIWDRIVQRVPDASLTITSDWSLWTGRDATYAVNPYRMAWAGAKNVTYLGAVKRSELIQIQQEAEFHLYPCTYEELFCISVAESQVAGAIPITSTTGAVNTTNRFGVKIGGIPSSGKFIDTFVDTTVGLMGMKNEDISSKAKEEFGLEKILDQWEEVFRD